MSKNRRLTPADDDRFGMPQSVFDAARENHGLNNPVVRMGMYVPTRTEVATWAADRLVVVLDLWFWESPTELVPSDAQVADVRSVLASRPDATTPEIQAAIAECDRYLAT